MSSFLGQKREFIPTKLQFKSKQAIPVVLVKKPVTNQKTPKTTETTKPTKKTEKTEKTLPLNEILGDDIKEFISEKEIKSNKTNKKEVKVTKPKKLTINQEYKTYKTPTYTEFEKKHLKYTEKYKDNKLNEKSKLKYEEKYEQYSKYLTSLPEHNDIPKIGPG